jgi:hypothetical protein
MPPFRTSLALLTVAALAVPAAAVAAPGPSNAKPAKSPADDAVVIAVIDSGFSPYSQDFLADRMPADAAGMPLSSPPDTWLPGFPSPDAFASYDSLDLTLDGTPGTVMDDLKAKDQAEWDTVQESGDAGIHYSWIPGTKVVGALTFGPQDDDRASDQLVFARKGTIYGRGGGEHGMGSASVSTGNTYGTCPQCLLVFIQYTTQDSAERALTWVHEQPWIDAVTNSYGFSAGIAVRDRIYNGSDVETGKLASERGQTTFFSAGNGLENAFTVPNSTLLSSQEGPDWTVTVGAVDPNNKDYTGTGKPADVAGLGRGYPSSRGPNVDSTSNFSGTSNATPQVAGTYGRTLWEARTALKGASRTQGGDVVATGKPVRCGATRPGCELGDGVLTASELRTRLFEGAKPSAGGYTGGLTNRVSTPAIADQRFAAEGYGVYRGHIDGAYDAELTTRLLDPLFGRAPAPERPEGEVDWFRVDSECRQHIWGDWSGGAFTSEEETPLPSPDPVAWPTRTAIQSACPVLTAPPPPIV